MKSVPCPVGTVVVDSYPFSLAGGMRNAADLAKSGADALAGYLGVINAERLAIVLGAGLGFIPVTLAGEYEDGAADEVAQIKRLGLPSGTTVFLDLEGMKAFKSDPPGLIAKINGWAGQILRAGCIPGLYVGVPQPLTSDELWRLGVHRYWRGQGSIRDRNNALAEPTGCGWCMTQMFPSYHRGGVLVDANMIGQDYKGRVPTMVVL